MNCGNTGNLINDGAGTSFLYGPNNRLLQATKSGITTHYSINYQGLRVRKSNPVETKHFVYDDGGKMLGEYDAAGNPIQELIWLGDTPVALRGQIPCANGVANCTETGTAFIWTDHLNTPREITRLNTTTNQHQSIWKWEGLPFGETAANANPSNVGVMTFNHRFPGQYYDQETGLHQNWHRDYEPRLGRYVQSDPIGLAAGTNTYVYVNSVPILETDRTGLRTDIDDVYRIASRWARESGLPGAHNGQQDAFRHCAGSCLARIHFGDGAATFWGWANECRGDLNGQPPSERQMDDANNQVGRDIGGAAAMPDACKNMCMGALHAGLLVLSPGAKPSKPGS